MYRLIFIAFVAVSAPAAALQAQQTPPATQGPMKATPDERAVQQVPDARQFAHRASMANLFEIEAARLATVRARDPDTGIFAQQILNDQLKAQADLKVAAEEEGVGVASKLDPAHQEKLKALEEVPGERFDAVFYSTQARAQESALKLLAAYGDKGEREALRAFAQSSHAMIKMHFARVRAPSDL